MDEIEKNKNGKCLRICPLTSPDEDELIKRLSKILKHPSVGCVIQGGLGAHDTGRRRSAWASAVVLTFLGLIIITISFRVFYLIFRWL